MPDTPDYSEYNAQDFALLLWDINKKNKQLESDLAEAIFKWGGRDNIISLFDYEQYRLRAGSLFLKKYRNEFGEDSPYLNQLKQNCPELFD